VSESTRLRELLQPGRIGPLETRNRIVMAPMGSFLAEEDGHLNERHKLYYETRAKGGAGLVIVEVAAVDFPRGAAMFRQIGLSDDGFIPGLADLAERIHRHGAKVSIQLQHAGKIATRDLAEGRPLSVPSADIPMPMAGVLADLTADEVQQIVKNYARMPEGGSLVHELSVQEIQVIVTRFAEAASRAKQAGFDGVEIHAGHGYLIAEFLSRASNKRQDHYGGKLEDRARILLEVIGAIRKAVGQDFPVWCRLDGKEFGIEDGITVEDARQTAKLAEEAGLNAIHVSAYGGPSGIGFTEATLVHPKAGLLPLAAGIKKVVGVPVIAVGRITPEQGERALRQGQADFIAMARPLLADPELPNKLAAGRPEDIRPCIYCYTCVGQIFVNQSLRCAVNPATAREAEFEIEKSETPKQVLVVGGGPAGMEAARVAALRGHRVTLCERNRRLGGTALFSSLVWEENGNLVDYLATQVDKLPIDLRLGQKVTPETVAELKPDIILLAVGAKREVPSIPGVERPSVLSGDELRQLMAGAPNRLTAAKLSLWQRTLLWASHTFLGLADHPSRVRELSKHWMPIGKRVAVIGGGLVGLELAEFLVKRGRHVTILEEGEWLAPQMAIPRRWRTLHELRERGAVLLSGVHLEAIVEKGVAMTTKDGDAQTIEADHVILAAGVVPNRDLYEAIRARDLEVHLLGDCSELSYIEGSILDGARIGRAI
jgi:2,4-dienoyl-CoA reductase (NADPH2)